jgi:hypothetical protein
MTFIAVEKDQSDMPWFNITIVHTVPNGNPPNVKVIRLDRDNLFYLQKEIAEALKED